MILPPRNSRQMAIIKTLRAHGTLTLVEGIALHGLPYRVTVADMSDMYEELVVIGCLVRCGLHYRVSAALHDFYAPPAPARVPAGAPATARAAPPFKPLSARFMVSSCGQREGSNDLRKMPSWYGPQHKD